MYSITFTQILYATDSRCFCGCQQKCCVSQRNFAFICKRN